MYVFFHNINIIILLEYAQLTTSVFSVKKIQVGGYTSMLEYAQLTTSVFSVKNIQVGGYTSIRHNEIRDHTAHLMTEVCHNVAIEPHLHPLNGETLRGASSITQNGARLDVAADGFWGSTFERAFFDVRVFNPHTPSHQRSSPQACYRSHENAKKRAYDQRIREVEHGTFCPLVFSCTGGMGRAASTTYKKTRRPHCSQEGPAVQQDNGLDKVLSLLLAPPGRHHVLPRSQILDWPRHQTTRGPS